MRVERDATTVESPQASAAPRPPRIGITRSGPSRAESGACPSASSSSDLAVAGQPADDRHRDRYRGAGRHGRQQLVVLAAGRRLLDRRARAPAAAARARRPRRVPEAAASRRTSVAMPSEMSSMAVATPAQRPALGQPRASPVAVYPPAACPPSVPVTTSRSPGRPPDRSTGPLGPADRRDRDDQHRAAREVAAGDRDAVLGHPRRQLAHPGKLRRARRTRPAGTPAPRPSPPCRTGSPPPRDGRCRRAACGRRRSARRRRACRWTAPGRPRGRPRRRRSRPRCRRALARPPRRSRPPGRPLIAWRAMYREHVRASSLPPRPEASERARRESAPF